MPKTAGVYPVYENQFQIGADKDNLIMMSLVRAQLGEPKVRREIYEPFFKTGIVNITHKRLYSIKNALE